MRKIPYYHVDAFASAVFRGNPAGVCPLEEWLPDSLLQGIAAENNLSETAFFVQKSEHFELRWFTPVLEIDLCGHATVAAAHILFTELGWVQPAVRFHTKSGWVCTARRGNIIELDFPSRPPAKCSVPPDLIAGFGRTVREVFSSRDYLVVFDSESEVASLRPDFAQFMKLDRLGVIATAPGSDSDFVSRFFAPKAGIAEDPVTGSAHCTLIPFWAERLGKTEMVARQISMRGGELFCRNLGERVGIGGRAVTYSKGTLDLHTAL